MKIYLKIGKKGSKGKKDMLNYLWGIMLLCGIVVGIINGETQEISNSVINAAKEAVTLCITMLGVMSFWTGLMQVARASGILDKMTKLLQPILCFLFPEIPEDSPAREYIAGNMVANILGLGWAATPMGLKAMKELKKLDIEVHNGKDTGVASNAMCTFLIINISSLQLIPINIIAYRSQYGSINPTGIVGIGLLATCISTIAAILYCKWKSRTKQY